MACLDLFSDQVGHYASFSVSPASDAALRRCTECVGTGFFDRAEAELLRLWRATQTRREVVMPLHLLADRHSRDQTRIQAEAITSWRRL